MDITTESHGTIFSLRDKSVTVLAARARVDVELILVFKRNGPHIVVCCITVCERDSFAFTNCDQVWNESVFDLVNLDGLALFFAVLFRGPVGVRWL